MLLSAEGKIERSNRVFARSRKLFYEFADRCMAGQAALWTEQPAKNREEWTRKAEREIDHEMRNEKPFWK